jgi:hypothetical protein
MCGVADTSKRRQTIGLAPRSHTLICTIVAEARGGVRRERAIFFRQGLLRSSLHPVLRLPHYPCTPHIVMLSD